MSTADGLYSALTNLRLCCLRMRDLMPLGTHSHRGKQILQKYSNHFNVVGAIRVKKASSISGPKILGPNEQNLLARGTWSSEIFHACLYKI